MKSLMRCQVKRLPAKPSEVWLDFEAFLLAPSTNYTTQSKKPRREGQQWIHTTVLACLKDEDCKPVKFRKDCAVNLKSLTKFTLRIRRKTAMTRTTQQDTEDVKDRPKSTELVPKFNLINDRSLFKSSYQKVSL